MAGPLRAVGVPTFEAFEEQFSALASGRRRAGRQLVAEGLLRACITECADGKAKSRIYVRSKMSGGRWYAVRGSWDGHVFSDLSCTCLVSERCTHTLALCTALCVVAKSDWHITSDLNPDALKCPNQRSRRRYTPTFRERMPTLSWTHALRGLCEEPTPGEYAKRVQIESEKRKRKRGAMQPNAVDSIFAQINLKGRPLTKFTVEELRHEARERGLLAGGSKEDLVNRVGKALQPQHKKICEACGDTLAFQAPLGATLVRISCPCGSQMVADV
jgi:hypothetical protein